MPPLNSKWPWFAILARKVNGSSFQNFCSASIITEEFLITSAHCIAFFDFDNENISVIVGSSYVNVEHGNHEPFRMIGIVADYYIHGEFESGTSYNDIAVLKLWQPLTFNKHVQPICLPKKSNRHLDFYSGKSVYVGGWGRTNDQSSSNVLLTDMIQVYPYQSCNKWHNITFGKHGQIRQRAIPNLFDWTLFCGGRTYGEVLKDMLYHIYYL